MRLGLVQHQQVGIGGQRTSQQDEPPLPAARARSCAATRGTLRSPSSPSRSAISARSGSCGGRERGRERRRRRAPARAAGPRSCAASASSPAEALELELCLASGRAHRRRSDRAASSSRSSCARRPSTRPCLRTTSPASGRRSPASSRSSVVLPLPFGPTIPSFVRSCTASVTPARSGALPGAYVTSTSCAIRRERRARARRRSAPSAWRRRCASSPGRPPRRRRPGSRGSGSGRRSRGCRRR